MRVLVAHASAHGSTAEVAERIGQRLREAGLDTDVVPMRDVGGVDGYDALVLGSAVHNQAWLPEAVESLRRNAPGLADRPAWVFSVGMSDALPRLIREAARDGQRKAIDKGLSGVLSPKEHRVFSGVFEADQMPKGLRIAYRAVGGRFGDHRNWEEIDGWGRQIAGELGGNAARS
jgi:menaquinone-dependent protoporphyrinogen oxidase